MVDGYRRIDNITDHALTTFRAAYGDRITKDDIFFVYGCSTPRLPRDLRGRPRVLPASRS